MDFTALRNVNSDVLGWILIPGTTISYPIVKGSDNAYYLTHTWNKSSSAVGAIFMEQTNQPDFSDFHTILYGHRMNNGSMFAGLKYYKDLSYRTAHPAVYITDDSGTRKYDIFAAYEADVQGSTYQIGISSPQAKEAYIEACLTSSVIDTQIVPQPYDQILTLSTCTGNGHATRWVVQAVLRGVPPEESAPAEEAPEETSTPEITPEQAAAAESISGEAPLSIESSAATAPDTATMEKSSQDVTPAA